VSVEPNVCDISNTAERKNVFVVEKLSLEVNSLLCESLTVGRNDSDGGSVTKNDSVSESITNIEFITIDVPSEDKEPESPRFDDERKPEDSLWLSVDCSNEDE
jgi:hypothetical protein